jgi:phage/plasmid-like protein (TIGR03299 family)
MAHELSIRENGKVEMAFTGSRSKIWHGLGEELEVGAPIEVWKTQAGMDWEVFESMVKYQSAAGEHIFPDRKALFRSDTNTALSIVSNDYRVVQPGEVLEFFRDLTTTHGMALSTAGVLFGGKRFWALAETGKDFKLAGEDEVKGNLLLVTSVDGTLSTTAKFVSERVVCNNTLSIALNESSKNLVKKTHRSDFDANSVKLDLGLIDDAWDKFKQNVETLASTKMTENAVQEFYQKLFFDPKKEEQSWGDIRKVNQLLNLYRTGAGADIAKGTAWGALNAITNMYTHGSGKRNESQQFWDASFGGSDKIKNEAMAALLA